VPSEKSSDAPDWVWSAWKEASGARISAWTYPWSSSVETVREGVFTVLLLGGAQSVAV
jgi:hypothetical protein